MMNLLRILYFSVFFTFALAAPSSSSPHVLDPSENDILLPHRALSPRVPPKGWGVITNQPTVSHTTWGNYPITFLATTAILPIAGAATPMADFYRQAHVAIINAITSGLTTNTYSFTFGALKLYVDTLDGGHIDWQMLIHFTSRMVGWSNRGVTDFYVALVRDRVAGSLTVVALETAAGTASMWLSGGASVAQFENDPFSN
ncbi:hypothetical protein BDR22DRAFT_821805 [Usnea florida]